MTGLTGAGHLDERTIPEPKEVGYRKITAGLGGLSAGTVLGVDVLVWVWEHMGRLMPYMEFGELTPEKAMGAIALLSSWLFYYTEEK